MFNTLQHYGLYSPWNSLSQKTGVGSLSLLQGIFPTQGSSPGLLHCRQILNQLSHKESPRILKWVAHPFSSRSCCCRNWTGVSRIAGRFFTNWAIREARCTENHHSKWHVHLDFQGSTLSIRQDMESTKSSSARKVRTRQYIYNWNTTQL